jgi:hypothetical protein
MKLRRMVLLATLVAAAWTTLGDDACRAEVPRPLFSNYYVEPSIAGGAGAKMYPSPHPVPAWVGNTYYTYQPLYPHHHMWSHHHVYRKYKPGCPVPVNTTRAYYW